MSLTEESGNLNVIAYEFFPMNMDWLGPQPML